MALTLCFPIPPAPAMDAMNCGVRSGRGSANEDQKMGFAKMGFAKMALAKMRAGK
jgi:hypothetical protein